MPCFPMGVDSAQAGDLWASCSEPRNESLSAPVLELPPSAHGETTLSFGRNKPESREPWTGARLGTSWCPGSWRGRETVVAGIFWDSGGWERLGRQQGGW